MQDTVSMLQTSGGYMDSISNSLTDMKRLAVEAQSGTLSPSDLDSVKAEFKIFQEDVTSITSDYNASGSYNDVKLFQGGSEKIQTGATQDQTKTIDNPDLSVQNQASIGTVDTYAYDSSNKLVGSSHADVQWGDMINSVSGLDVTDPNAIGALSKAVDYVASAKASNSTSISDLVASYGSMATYDSNLNAAYSLNADTEMASSMMELTKSLIMNKSANAMQAQGNSLNNLALQWALNG